jgi:hypothetical protein
MRSGSFDVAIEGLLTQFRWWMMSMLNGGVGGSEHFGRG